MTTDAASIVRASSRARHASPDGEIERQSTQHWTIVDGARPGAPRQEDQVRISSRRTLRAASPHGSTQRWAQAWSLSMSGSTRPGRPSRVTTGHTRAPQLIPRAQRQDGSRPPPRGRRPRRAARCCTPDPILSLSPSMAGRLVTDLCARGSGAQSPEPCHRLGSDPRRNRSGATWGGPPGVAARLNQPHHRDIRGRVKLMRPPLGWVGSRRKRTTRARWRTPAPHLDRAARSPGRLRHRLARVARALPTKRQRSRGAGDQRRMLDTIIDDSARALGPRASPGRASGTEEAPDTVRDHGEGHG